MLCSSL